MATERRDIVIVGAGLAGAATAWHLARRGVTDVLLVDREPAAGMHSSGRNAGLLREKVDQPAWQPLTTEGAAVLRSGDLAGFARTGSVLLGWGDRDVRDFVPRARGRGLWCPDDGIVDVPALLAAYLDGRDVRWSCATRGWWRDGADMVVDTLQGEIRARIVVNAAGAWAGALGGAEIRPTNRHLYVSEPMDGLDGSWPFVWDVERGLYFRPESGGLLLCPCDEGEAAPGDYTDDPRWADVVLERVRDQQPDLGDVRIAYRWVGQRVFSADRIPLIGYDPREPGLFWVAGLGGHGVTGSFAIGRRAADLLTGATRAPRGDPYAPGRFLVAA